MANVDLSIRPPSYDIIDSQFESKKIISPIGTDSCFWHTSDLAIPSEQYPASQSFAEGSDTPTIVEFRNPFDYPNDLNAMLHQSQGNLQDHVSPIMPDFIDPSTLSTYDLDIDHLQYLHFDYAC